MVLLFPSNPQAVKLLGVHAVIATRSRREIWADLKQLTMNDPVHASQRDRLYAELKAHERFERSH